MTKSEIKSLVEKGLKEGDYWSAVSLVQKYLFLNKKDDEVWCMLGILRDHLAQTKKFFLLKHYYHLLAVRCYRRALALNDRSKCGLLGMSRVYWHQDKYDKALTYLDQTQQIYDNDPEVYLLLANVHKAAQHYDIAEKFYQKVIKLKPDNYGAYFNLVRIYIDMGQSSQARLFFDRGQAVANKTQLSDLEREVIEDINTKIKALEG